jgi:hypothetical protein
LEAIKKGMKMHTLLYKIVLKFVVRSRLNILIGRKLFYNDGGFISNAIGRHVKKRDTKNSKKLGFHSYQNSAVQDLRLKGFLISNNTVDEALMDDLAKTWDRWASKQEVPDDGRLELSSADSSDDVNEFLPMLQKLITKEVEDTLESYFESYSRIINFHIYRNRKALNRSELNSYGATANWHTDGSTSESIKLFFMLSEVNEKNGPMEVISRADTKKVIKNNKLFYPDTTGETVNYISKECEITSLRGKKGTSFFGLTNDVLHRATIPNEGEFRDLIVFYITSSSKKRSVEQQLKEAKYREVIGLQRLVMN